MVKHKRICEGRTMFKGILLRSSLVSLSLIIGEPEALSHASLDMRSASQGPIRVGVRIPHGCEGSATVGVRLSIPEGIVGVKPAPKPGWKISMKKGPYAKTYNFFHGTKLSEGVKQIEWRGGPLLDENFDDFQFIGFVTEALASGDTVAFPVTQICEKGQIAWNEIVGPGVDPHSLKFPAPTLKIITASSEDGVNKTRGLIVSKAWARATPSGAMVGAGYLEIVNSTNGEDTLLSISTSIAKRVEIHKMLEDNGVIKMRSLPSGLSIPAGKTVELKPGGIHLMFLDLKSSLKDGQIFDAELSFAKAGKISVRFHVAGIGANKAAETSSHHH